MKSKYSEYKVKNMPPKLKKKQKQSASDFISKHFFKKPNQDPSSDSKSENEVDENQQEINKKDQQVENVDTPVVELIEDDIEIENVGLSKTPDGKRLSRSPVRHSKTDKRVHLLSRTDLQFDSDEIDDGKNNENKASDVNENEDKNSETESPAKKKSKLGDDNYKSNNNYNYNSTSAANLSTEKNHPPPNFKFPTKKYGNKNRGCNAIWFQEHPWLTYKENTATELEDSNDKLLCHFCLKALSENLIQKPNDLSKTFIDGFSNWQNGKRTIIIHEKSQFHKDCVSLVESNTNVGELLSTEFKNERQKSCNFFLERKLMCFEVVRGPL